MVRAVKTPSKSISVKYDVDKAKSEGELDIGSKRGTSVLGALQGDHVTAYSLIEYGFIRALSKLKTEEVEQLFELRHRNSLREKRNHLYTFISSVAALDWERREELYSMVDGILRDYNRNRTKKKVLREETKRVKEDESLSGTNLSLALGAIEGKYKDNGTKIRDALTEMVRLLLTFYNHIPGTSYFPVKGFTPVDESATIRNSKRDLPLAVFEIVKFMAENQSERALTLKVQSVLLPNVLGLFHYPEITDESALGEHRGVTLTNKTKLSMSRDNDRNSLITMLTRHLHIIFSIYRDELSTDFVRDEITRLFVDSVIRGEKGKTNIGWPSFRNDIESITNEVKAGLKAGRDAVENSHYTKRKQYTDELVSSDDEDEPTRPIPIRVKIKKEEPIVSGISEQQELEQLRKLRSLIQNAKEGDISSSLRQQMEKECGIVFQVPSAMSQVDLGKTK
jgi:hypothetical protein